MWWPLGNDPGVAAILGGHCILDVLHQPRLGNLLRSGGRKPPA